MKIYPLDYQIESLIFFLALPMFIRYGLTSTQDSVIWDYAKDNDFVIVSKDADMHDLSLALGNPQKSFGFDSEIVQPDKLQSY